MSLEEEHVDVGEIGRGLIAGAAGTLALTAVTYLDMALRGRSASPVPAQTVRQLAERMGGDLAPDGDEQTRHNRGEGLGELFGQASGVGLGMVYGIVAPRMGRVPVIVGAGALTLAAMVGANLPAIRSGVTDPTTWGVEGWMADVVPHAFYGLVTAEVYDAVH